MYTMDFLSEINNLILSYLILFKSVYTVMSGAGDTEVVRKRLSVTGEQC